MGRPNAVRSWAYWSVRSNSRLGARHAAGRADQPLALELPHDVVEALADLAQDGRGGHADVLEGQERRVRGVHPQLLELLLANHSWRVHRHQDQSVKPSYPASGSVLVTSTIMSARWPLVMNVFEPLITYSSPSWNRPRLDSRDIRAGVGLGDPQAEDLLALDRGHDPLLLLLLGAEGQDRRHRHVGVDSQAHGQPAAARVHDLLGQHELV